MMPFLNIQKLNPSLPAHSAKARGYYIWCGLITAAFVLIFVTIAHAQITKTARVELRDNQPEIYFGHNIYLTEDADRKLTAQVIATRHQNNLRGKRQKTDILNLGLAAKPVWLVFSVTNNSSAQEWILHFGDVFDGRYGLAKTLFVKNHTTGEVFADLTEKAEEKDVSAARIKGSAIPVKVTKGKTELLLVQLEAEGGLPNTYAPALMTTDQYHSALQYGSYSFSAALIFLIAVTAIFATISYLYHASHYLLFSGYYALHGVLLILLSGSFFTTFFMTGEILAFLYTISVLIALATTKYFLNIRAEDHSENTLIFALACLLIVSSLVNVVLFSENSIINDILIFVPSAASLLILCLISFWQAQKGKYAGHYLATGWAIAFAGSLFTALASAQITGMNVLTLNAYWLCLLPQAGFFIAAARRKIRLEAEENKQALARQARAAQSKARLQQSKESADQTRLLRVIERERELMTELREREMQRTEEMRRAKEMADEANNAKSAFLAVVSHEIRTPMTGIMGVIRLLSDTKMTKEQNDYILAIQKSGDTMMALLNDILDFEKIETGSMELESIDFDFPKLVQGVVMLMSGHAADNEILLECDIPDNFPRYLIGDPTRLRQVLLNLVSNAIKFTDEGGVTIKLRATKLEDKPEHIKGDYEIYIAVEDTGVGIPAEAQASLFAPFQQADASVSRKYGGSGLGLAICQRLVEAMGSAIRLTSQENVGSTFYFSLLMEAGSEEKAEAIETGTYQHTRGQIPALEILVIEDNEINRKVLQSFLEKDDHDVTLCDTGESAIEITKNHRFDIIFMDINLPGMSGTETAKTIRTLPDKDIADTPIVAITGNVAQEDIEACYEAGINDFIAKPIDYDKLRKTLSQVEKQDDSQNAKGKPPSAKQKPKPIYVETDDEEKAPIHDFLDEIADKKENASEEKSDSSFNIEKLDENVIDKTLIAELLKSVGEEQVTELVSECISKAEEITQNLVSLKEEPDIKVIYDRGHELKGMSANFGMKQISDIADKIEKAGKNEDVETAVKAIEALPAALETLKENFSAVLKPPEQD